MAKPSKKWQLMERTVAALERAIVPTARVLVNQTLPILTSREGSVAQCDVVIQNGEPPRQTFSIVEVQKRGRKVDVNEFRGWCGKRDKVGAQHLLCVSESGFPKSVIEEAEQEGASVRLLTLAELEWEDWPIKVIGGAIIFIEVSPHDLKHMNLVCDGPPVEVEVKRNAQVFTRTDSAGLLTPDDLALEAVRSQREFQFLEEGDHPVRAQYVPPSGISLKFVMDSQTTLLKAVNLELMVRVARTPLPLTCSEYVQIDYNGSLAFALTASGKVADNQVDARLIFRPHGSGLLRPVSFEVDGLPAGAVSGLSFIPGP